ncbi:MAG: hypothetical protein RR750_00550 [Citrobacter sp.]
MTTFTKEQLIEQAKNNLIGLKNYVTVYPERAESEAMNIRLAEIALAALTAQEAFESWFIKVHLPGIRQSQLKAAECKLVHRVAQSAWNGCCSAILEGDDK